MEKDKDKKIVEYYTRPSLFVETVLILGAICILICAVVGFFIP